MVYFGHIKKDISCLDETKCLLANPNMNKFLMCSEQTKNFFGCYLFFDMNEEVWIRSGSATGEGGFGKRIRAHEKRAQANKNDDNSRFYHLFLHSNSTCSKNPHKNGLFEYLVSYVGGYFTYKSALKTDFSKGYGDEGGVFSYTEK